MQRHTFLCACVLALLMMGCSDDSDNLLEQTEEQSEENPASSTDEATESNARPIAHSDELTVAFESVIDLPTSQLLNNDEDADGDFLTITSTQVIAGGEVALTDDATSLRITPALETTALVWFEYEVSDGKASSFTEVNLYLSQSNNGLKLEGELSEFDVIKLRWPMYDGLEFFTVYRKQETETEFVEYAQVAAGVPEYQDANLNQGTTYSYKVAFTLNDEVYESNTFSMTTQTLTDRELYLLKCASCHGENGEGKAGFPPLDQPMTVPEMVERTDKSSFSRCKIPGGCAEQVSNYIYKEILEL
ncbi:MAG: cadherin-like domain-containing protein [Pseudomonadota bacterium]